MFRFKAYWLILVIGRVIKYVGQKILSREQDPLSRFKNHGGSQVPYTAAIVQPVVVK